MLALREETEQLMPSGAHMMSGAQQGRLLQMLVRLSRAQRVLELGCFTGYATLWMALGLPEGGKVVTCERDERAAEVARRHFASAGVASRVDLVMGDALDAVRGDALEGAPFDLIFLDADKKRYAEYCRLLRERGLLAPHGLILADNVLWKGQVLELLSTTDEIGEIGGEIVGEIGEMSGAGAAEQGRSLPAGITAEGCGVGDPWVKAATEVQVSP